MQTSKIIAGLCALIMIAVVGCKKSDMQHPEETDQGTYKISVTTGSDSKVVISDGVSVRWKSDDVITVAEVGQGDKFTKLLAFGIDPQSISYDGKSADFYGPNLTVGKKYIAIHGISSPEIVDNSMIDPFHPYEGTIIRRQNTNIDQEIENQQPNDQPIKNNLFMLSRVVEFDGSKPPFFIFRHMESVLDITITAAPNISGVHSLDQITVVSPMNSFSSTFVFDALGKIELPFPKESSYFYEFRYDQQLSDTIRIRVPIWNNPEYDNLTGDFTFHITTKEGLVSSVKRPAKSLKAGTIYNVNIEFNPQDKVANDRAVLTYIYNTMGGDKWVDDYGYPVKNWGSEKPLNEWTGVRTHYHDGRVISIDINNNFSTTPYEIPSQFAELDRLEILILSGPMKGAIPSEFSNLSELYWLALGNQTCDPDDGLTDVSAISKNPRISLLDLRHHKLLSSQLAFVSELRDLEDLYLIDNAMTGNFPSYLTTTLLRLKTLTIKDNCFTGKLPAELIQHPRWPYFARGIVAQKGAGFDLRGVDFQFPHFEVDDIDGNRISSKQITEANNLTVFFGWEISIPISKAYISQLQNIYNTYKANGLEVVGMHYNGSVNEVKNYVTQNQIPWYNCCYSLNGLIYEGEIMTFPYITVCDKYGNIVFDEHLISASHTRDKLIDFINDYFNVIPPPQYESTDYSQDGKVLTLQTATKGSGVNIVIMGDGFVDKDMAAGGKYEQRMTEAMEHFFSVEPTKSYRQYFNVYAVKAVSKNEGISTRSQTAMNCSFGEGTFISGDLDAIWSYAEKVPAIKIVGGINSLNLVILNSPKYAGTCHFHADAGATAFCPTVSNDAGQFAAVVHHEMVGHAFGRLADEYIYYNQSIIQTEIDYINRWHTDFNGFYNVSTNKSNVPWKHFFGQPSYSMVGLYEGCYFYSRGVWRAEQNSCMNNNVPYFNGPSRELIVKRIKTMSNEPYFWSDFVAKDKCEPIRQTRAQADFVPLAPPVIVKTTPKYKK